MPALLLLNVYMEFSHPSMEKKLKVGSGYETTYTLSNGPVVLHETKAVLLTQEGSSCQNLKA